MPLKLFANQFSTEFALVAASVNMLFGFNATYVRVSNLSAVPIHVNFMSTENATTGDPELRPGKDFTLTGITTSGVSVFTTSTTTSTATDVSHRVTVSAFGG